MKVRLLLSAMGLAALTAAFTYQQAVDETSAESASPSLVVPTAEDAASTVETWRRPPGPPKVALQAGHWRAAEAPDEQAGLRNNGTRGGGRYEWEVNLEIARRTAAFLEEKGYVVEILPTKIPPGYWADLFVSIHADGSSSASASGYRAAAPRRDATGRAAEFAALLERTYGDATGLPHYPEVTRRMRGYYAFNYRRYRHALHPMTTGVILETGFLTSPRDRGVIVNAPDRAARGIAEAVLLYLETTDLEAEIVRSPLPEPRTDFRRRTAD